MTIEYNSQAVLSVAEDLLEVGMGFNSIAASMLKDYAALLAKDEHECYACGGSGELQTSEEPWPCHTCKGSGKVHFNPLHRLLQLRDRWDSDAREYLNTWGQHMPVSLDCMVEQLDTALKPLRAHEIRGKYMGKFSTVKEFLKDRKADDHE